MKFSKIRRFFKEKGYKKRVPLLVYLLILAGTAVLVSFKGGAFSYVLFFATLAYIPAAAIQIAYAFTMIRVYQEVNVRLVYKNSAVPYSVTLGNAGPIPIGGLKLIRDREFTHFKKDFTGEVFKLLPGENREIETDISCRYAGSYTVGITSLSVTDIFGIARITFDIPAPLRLHVLPTVTDIAAADIGRLYEENMNISSIYKIDRKEDFPGNELKKYTPGDPLKYVHWKNYARTGEMYERMPDRQDSEMMTLVVVNEHEPTVVERDYLLEYVVSAANWFAGQSKPVKFMYWCSGVKDFLIDGYDSFNTFYFEKLREIGRETLPDTEEKLMASLENSGGIAAIFIEKKGEISLRKDT